MTKEQIKEAINQTREEVKDKIRPNANYQGADVSKGILHVLAWFETCIENIDEESPSLSELPIPTPRDDIF